MVGIDGTRPARMRRHLVRSIAPALALAVVAGSAAATVTLVQLASDVGVVESEPPEVEFESGMEPDIELGPTDVIEDVDDERIGDETLLAFAAAVTAYGPPDYAAILTRRYDGSQWSLSGDDLSRLRWFGPGDPPSRDELDAHWPAVAEEMAAERAARLAAEQAAAAEREAELAARRDDPTLRALLDSFDPRTIWGSTPDYAHILSRRFPGAQWSLNGNDPVGGLTWVGPGPAPTRSQLDAMWADVAREMALELDPKELERWAGTGDQIYVDGVLRPKGWVGGANDPQPHPVATPEVDYRYLPHIANTNNGSPVGTIDILKDPTGGQNFEQRYGLDLTDLAAMIAEAHGYFGGSHGLGLGLNGDRELMWYSDQVDPDIVREVLEGLGALPDTADGTG